MSLSVVLFIVIVLSVLCVFFGQLLFLCKHNGRKWAARTEDLEFARRYLFIHDEVDCFDKKRELKEQLIKDCRDAVQARETQRKQAKAKLISIDTFLSNKS
ncbi:hypothetical protein [Alteromonas sp. a30]|uniref:hypothetical protein n=1 Tax=Alteromonas sp. a30 TaxID=2730917 RepID=UPI00227E4254|nr:hypothetical protein [Alteromonas sp. a30]MCY7295115.1 hypothetical protein [Alteromonas sp. a30]